MEVECRRIMSFLLCGLQERRGISHRKVTRVINIGLMHFQINPILFSFIMTQGRVIWRQKLTKHPLDSEDYEHEICDAHIWPYGPGRVIGIATGYRLDGPGSNPGGGEIFRTCPDRRWGPLSLLYKGYRVFSGVKGGRIVKLTPHPILVPWSRKSRAIALQE